MKHEPFLEIAETDPLHRALQDPAESPFDSLVLSTPVAIESLGNTWQMTPERSMSITEYVEAIKKDFERFSLTGDRMTEADNLRLVDMEVFLNGLGSISSLSDFEELYRYCPLICSTKQQEEEILRRAGLQGKDNMLVPVVSPQQDSNEIRITDIDLKTDSASLPISLVKLDSSAMDTSKPQSQELLQENTSELFTAPQGWTMTQEAKDKIALLARDIYKTTEIDHDPQGLSGYSKEQFEEERRKWKKFLEDLDNVTALSDMDGLWIRLRKAHICSSDEVSQIFTIAGVSLRRSLFKTFDYLKDKNTRTIVPEEYEVVGATDEGKNSPPEEPVISTTPDVSVPPPYVPIETKKPILPEPEIISHGQEFVIPNWILTDSVFMDAKNAEEVFEEDQTGPWYLIEEGFVAKRGLLEEIEKTPETAEFTATYKKRLLNSVTSIPETYVFNVPKKVIESSHIQYVDFIDDLKENYYTKEGVRYLVERFVEDETEKKRLLALIDTTPLTPVGTDSPKVETEPTQHPLVTEILRQIDNRESWSLEKIIEITDTEERDSVLHDLVQGFIERKFFFRAMLAANEITDTDKKDKEQKYIERMSQELKKKEKITQDEKDKINKCITKAIAFEKNGEKKEEKINALNRFQTELVDCDDIGGLEKILLPVWKYLDSDDKNSILIIMHNKLDTNLFNTVETSTAPAPETDVEVVERQLKDARDAYIIEMIVWKNKRHVQEEKFVKVMTDLYGTKFDESRTKKVVKVDQTDLLEARGRYILAKKEKAKALGLFDAQGTPHPQTPEEGERIKLQISEGLLRQAEIENGIFQSELVGVESKLPKKEKNILIKSWEKYKAMNPTVRRYVVPVVMGGVAIAGGGLVGGATYAAQWGARTLGGIAAARAIGSLVDRDQRRAREENLIGTRESYKQTTGLDTYEKAEEEFMKSIEKEKDNERKRKLDKTVAMVGAGFIGGMTMGQIENALAVETGFEALPPGTPKPFDGIRRAGSQSVYGAKNFVHDLFSKKSGEVPESGSGEGADFSQTATTDPLESTNPVPPTESANVLKTNAPVENVSAQQPIAEVDLSSRGFIQTIEDLKVKLRADYASQGGETAMTEDVKSFIHNSSTQEAIKMGMYDPEHGTSAMGYAEEKLAIDSHGHVTYEHPDHVSPGGKLVHETINETDHRFSTVHPDKMFTPKVSGVHHSAFDPESLPHTPSLQPQPDIVPPPVLDAHGLPTPESYTMGDTGPDAEITIPGSEATASLENIIPGHLPIQHHFEIGPGQTVDVVDIGGNNTMFFNGEGGATPIAHSVSVGTPSETIMQLEDKFQNGYQHAAIRNVYVEAMSKMPTADPAHFGVSHASRPFEEGQVTVIQGESHIVKGHVTSSNPESVKVFLNGKEIAHGTYDKWSKIKLEHGIPKGGLFLGDTVYDRALKFARKAINLTNPSQLR